MQTIFNINSNIGQIEMYDWIIFTDLDGSLLDHHDYSFNQAQPALNRISQLGIPLIINSSKTYAEIIEIRQKMHNNWAFAVENGAAVYLPSGQLSSDGDSMEQVILGMPHQEILNILKQLRKQNQFLFKGFSDYTIDQLMAETGLSQTQAEQAKQRIASEPLDWLDSEENLHCFINCLKQYNLQLVQGGRFFHVMGQNDKSQAMAWLLNKFNKKQSALSIAIGDSQNDKKMLEKADYAAVIRNIKGSFLELDKHPDQIIHSDNTAPTGWQEVIDKLFEKLNKGENNE